jgi:hypothetical protein
MTTPDRVPDRDPTLVRSQPALTTSTGRIWLIAGAALSVIAIVVLAFLTALDPRTATIGIVFVIAIYVGMVIVRMLVDRPRARLALMAVGMLAIAAIALTCVGLIASHEWEALAS